MGTNPLSQPERRRRVRLKLAWPVCFCSEGRPERIYATTSDISSDGFYCLVRPDSIKTIFVSGRVLKCRLLIPASDPEERDLKMVIDCRIRVIRVNDQELVGGKVGVACQVEDYHLFRTVAKDPTSSIW